MTFLSVLLPSIGMVSGAIVLHFAMQSIDAMSKVTHHGIRSAFIFLAGGGFSQIIGPFAINDMSEISVLLFSVGSAMLLLFDRRLNPKHKRHYPFRRASDKLVGESGE